MGAQLIMPEKPGEGNGRKRFRSGYTGVILRDLGPEGSRAHRYLPNQSAGALHARCLASPAWRRHRM